MIALNAELLFLIELTLALFDFEIEEAVGFSRPCDGSNEDLGHLHLTIHWC